MVLGIPVAKIQELVDAHVAEIAEEIENSNSKALTHPSVSTGGHPDARRATTVWFSAPR
jgi:hypothetical protein